MYDEKTDQTDQMQRISLNDLSLWIDDQPPVLEATAQSDLVEIRPPSSRSTKKEKPLSVVLPASVSTCPSCQDAGRVTVAADSVPSHTVVLGRYEAAGSRPAIVIVPCPVCDAGRERASDYVQSRSKLPEELREIRLGPQLNEYRHQKNALHATIDLLKRRNGWLTFVGGYGSGKTTLIAAALNHLGDMGIVGGYWTAAELVRHLHFDPEQPSAGGIRLKRLQQTPALAIDELDKYRSTPFAEESMFELLNYRHQQRANLITLLGTNDEEALPGALRSRLRAARCTIVNLGRDDVRQVQYEALNPWERGEGEEE